MTAYVLIVEDDPDFIGAIQEVLRGMSPGVTVQVAQSRDAAMALLVTEFFDIIILDLKIPTTDGALDADSQHGFAVFTRAQKVASGTPVFVLTGSPAEDFIPDLVGNARQVDVWGEGRNVRTVAFLPKYRFDSFQEQMLPNLRSIDTLADVELDRAGIALETPDDRLIRIFARRYGGARVVMSLLGGGLSGAKVLRLRVTNSHGAPVHVGKPAALGIADLARPDYGEPLPPEAGEVPMYWACGLTGSAALEAARPPIAITHAPGCMVVTDLPG